MLLVCLRISDLEQQVDRMRQQQDQLQKRLKEESDKKGRLEVTTEWSPLCFSLSGHIFMHWITVFEEFMI